MEAKSKTFQGVQVVEIEGEVDMNSAPCLREKFREAFGRKQAVVAELSRVTYMDSSGVAVMVEAFQWSRKEKIPFIIAAPSDAVQSVIKLARLDTFFKISDTLEEAL